MVSRSSLCLEASTQEYDELRFDGPALPSSFSAWVDRSRPDPGRRPAVGGGYFSFSAAAVGAI